CRMLPREAVGELEWIQGGRVEDRYELVRRIGRGACGIVYAARALPAARRHHGRARVALKTLDATLAGDGDAIARMTHEAFLGARIRHANLAAVVDFGWLSPGRPYLAMELLDGATLDRVLRV